MSQAYVPFLITENGVTIVYNGKQYSAPSDFWSYNEIISRLKKKDYDGIDRLFDTNQIVQSVAEKIETAIKNEYTFLGKTITISKEAPYEIKVNGHPVYENISKRIIRMMKDGFDIKPLIKFIARLSNNPSMTSMKECYPFMESANVAIDEEGYIIAYKRVRNDYYDIHSGTVKYEVGSTVEQDRNMVNDDRSVLCSDGLHFCSFDYLRHFVNAPNDRILIVQVDPADVVSVPLDFNNAKARACRIHVIGEIKEEMSEEFPTGKNDVLGKKAVFIKENEEHTINDKGDDKFSGIKGLFHSTVILPVISAESNHKLDSSLSYADLETSGMFESAFSNYSELWGKLESIRSKQNSVGRGYAAKKIAELIDESIKTFEKNAYFYESSHNKVHCAADGDFSFSSVVDNLENIIDDDFVHNDIIFEPKVINISNVLMSDLVSIYNNLVVIANYLLQRSDIDDYKPFNHIAKSKESKYYFMKKIVKVMCVIAFIVNFEDF